MSLHGIQLSTPIYRVSCCFHSFLKWRLHSSFPPSTQAPSWLQSLGTKDEIMATWPAASNDSCESLSSCTCQQRFTRGTFKKCFLKVWSMHRRRSHGSSVSSHSELFWVRGKADGETGPDSQETRYGKEREKVRRALGA